MGLGWADGLPVIDGTTHRDLLGRVIVGREIPVYFLHPVIPHAHGNSLACVLTPDTFNAKRVGRAATQPAQYIKVSLLNV